MAEYADFMAGIEPLSEEIPEEAYVTPGEFELKVEAIKFYVDEQTGESPRFSVTLSFPEHDDVEPVFHTLWLPHKDKTKRDNMRSQRELKKFCDAFDMAWPPDLPLQEDELRGRKAWADVGVKTTDKYGTEHIIKGWVAPA
jgi:hypothetical protein